MARLQKNDRAKSAGGGKRLPLPLWTKFRDIEKPRPSSSASPIAARSVALASDPLSDARMFTLRFFTRRHARKSTKHDELSIRSRSAGEHTRHEKEAASERTSKGAMDVTKKVSFVSSA